MPPDDPIPSIEVPVVDEAPDIETHTDQMVEFANYLLTSLLRFESASLDADYRRTGGRWLVLGHTPEPPHLHEIIATTESLSLFRSVLARFGHLYLNGQLYGGYAELRLTQRGRSHGCAIYMANDQWREYWLRAYVSRKIFPIE